MNSATPMAKAVTASAQTPVCTDSRPVAALASYLFMKSCLFDRKAGCQYGMQRHGVRHGAVAFIAGVEMVSGVKGWLKPVRMKGVAQLLVEVNDGIKDAALSYPAVYLLTQSILLRVVIIVERRIGQRAFKWCKCGAD